MFSFNCLYMLKLSPDSYKKPIGEDADILQLQSYIPEPRTIACKSPLFLGNGYASTSILVKNLEKQTTEVSSIAAFISCINDGLKYINK